MLLVHSIYWLFPSASLKRQRSETPRRDAPLPVICADVETGPDAHRNLLRHGRSRGWPSNPETDATCASSTSTALTLIWCCPISRLNCKNVPTFRFPTRAELGTGFYGPFHGLVVAQSIKTELRRAVPSASPLSLARAAANIVPLILTLLVKQDGRLSMRARAPTPHRPEPVEPAAINRNRPSHQHHTLPTRQDQSLSLSLQALNSANWLLLQALNSRKWYQSLSTVPADASAPVPVPAAPRFHSTKWLPLQALPTHQSFSVPPLRD
ncbi:unnamed protein product [Tilletia caries]|nr:unnamed protein product [Tilletia caries]